MIVHPILKLNRLSEQKNISWILCENRIFDRLNTKKKYE